MLVLTRSGENAKLHISGRGAAALELNLKREKSKWILLDDVPISEPDVFSFIIHDFLCLKKSVSGTASEICSALEKDFPEHKFKCNWLYRDLLQHDDEIRSLGIDYGKNKSNGIRSIFIGYDPNRDSSGGKMLYPNGVVPSDPEVGSNAYKSLTEENISDERVKENTVTAVPDKLNRGNALIAMAAEMMENNLQKQGITVPKFNTACETI